VADDKAKTDSPLGLQTAPLLTVSFGNLESKDPVIAADLQEFSQVAAAATACPGVLSAPGKDTVTIYVEGKLEEQKVELPEYTDENEDVCTKDAEKVSYVEGAIPP